LGSASFAWTGVETSFPAGYPAQSAADVFVIYIAAGSDEQVVLTQGVHFSVSLDGGGLVTVAPIALPPAPATLFVNRSTPAVQATDFSNLAKFGPGIHTRLHDAAALRAQELRRVINRAVVARNGESGQTLPRPSADKVIGWNHAGDGLVNIDVALLDVVMNPRRTLTSDRTYHVPADGTLQEIADTVLNALDRKGFNVVIDLTGALTAGAAFSSPGVGDGTITITSTAVGGASITVTNGDCISASHGASLIVDGNDGALTLSTITSGICLLTGPGGYISTEGVDFGPAVEHIKAGWNTTGEDAGGGTIAITGSYSISGDCGSHLHAPCVDAFIHYTDQPMTVTLTGTPAIGNFFAGVTAGEIFIPPTVSFDGPATGLKYWVHNGGKILGPASRATLPGDIAGITASGGVYNPSDDTSNLGVAYGAATATAARSTPAAGYADWYTDSTTKRFNDKNDAGVIATTVVPKSLVAGQFLTSIGTDGVAASAKPIVGYATGDGGAATQPTNKSSGVTINKACGRITMNNAALASAAYIGFTLTNNQIAATDVVIVNVKGGYATPLSYQIGVESNSAGSCFIWIRNLTGGSLSEALVIDFAVVKAVNA
jgi:hypothetical protein